MVECLSHCVNDPDACCSTQSREKLVVHRRTGEHDNGVTVARLAQRLHPVSRLRIGLRSAETSKVPFQGDGAGDAVREGFRSVIRTTDRSVLEVSDVRQRVPAESKTHLGVAGGLMLYGATLPLRPRGVSQRAGQAVLIRADPNPARVPYQRSR